MPSSLLPESQGQNLAVTVLYVPTSLEGGLGGVRRIDRDEWNAVLFLAIAMVLPTLSPRCRVNMAHKRQSGPDSDLGFQVKALKTF